MKANNIEPLSTVFTFYPCDTLDRIVFNVRLAKLLPLLCQSRQRFLQLHTNLKRAICNLIEQKSFIKFRNLDDTDSNDPEFHPQKYEYYPNFDLCGKSDFKSTNEFKKVDTFCIDEKSILSPMWCTVFTQLRIFLILPNS